MEEPSFWFLLGFFQIIIWAESVKHGLKDRSIDGNLDCGHGSCKDVCMETTRYPDVSRTTLTSYPSRPPSTTPPSRPPPDIDVCKCDKNCFLFGDCCEDFFNHCLNSEQTTLFQNISTLENVRNFVNVLFDKDESLEPQFSMFLNRGCHKVINQDDKISNYWMISDCIDDTSDPLSVQKCRDPPVSPLGVSPAYLLSHPNIPFRNIYCGVCNGYKQDDLKLWPSSINCPSMSTAARLSYTDILGYMNTSECYLTSTDPHEARECTDVQQTSMESCPLLDRKGRIRNERILCRSYLSPVYGDFGKKANIHCASCSEDTSYEDIKFQCNHFLFGDEMLPVCEAVSCSQRCDSYDLHAKCQCDVDCLFFGDCCFDFTSTCLNDSSSLMDINSKTSQLLLMINTKGAWGRPNGIRIVSDMPRNEDETPRERFSKSTKEKETLSKDYFMTDAVFRELMLLYLKYGSCTIFPGFVQGVWVINGCPEGKEELKCSLARNHSDVTQMTPVSHTDHSGIIFRNIYCALCNEVAVDKLHQWGTAIYCSPPVQVIANISELFSDGRCKVTVGELEGGRLCYNEDVEVIDGLPKTKLCELYRYPVLSMGVVIRNPHCNMRSGKNTICYDHDKEDKRLKHPIFKQRVVNDFGLGLLFNFNQDGSSDDIDIFRKCQTNDVYDYYHDICKKMICEQGRHVVNGVCVKNGTWFADEKNMVFKNGSWFLKVIFRIETDVPLSNTSFVLPRKLLKPLNAPLREHHERTEGGQEIVLEIEASFLDSYVDFASKVVTSFKRKMPSDAKYFEITVQNFQTTDELTCSFGAVTGLENVSMITISGNPYVNASDNLYPMNNIAFVLNLLSRKEHMQEAYACHIPLDCNPIVYNLTDFEMTNEILKSPSGLDLQNGSYFVSGDKVYACHNFIRGVTDVLIQLFSQDHVQGILTYVTFGISIASLVVTLTVYTLLPELRNFPGRLTMSLSASLLLAQSLFLMVNLPTEGPVCKVFAIVLHFTWLVTFMWMTAMSINLASTFLRKTQSSTTDRSISTRHTKFSVLVLGAPFILVTVTAVLDLLEIPDLDIGYGLNGVCWIGSQRASLLVFGVPIAVMVLVNLVAYVLTFVKIEKSLRMAKNVSSTRGDRNKAVIYWKMFTIMGLSWGFCFAAAFADVPALMYIFILLNGMQGFYIFIAFVCTGRVIKLLRKKMAGQEDTSTRQSTNMRTDKSKI